MKQNRRSLPKFKRMMRQLFIWICSVLIGGCLLGVHCSQPPIIRGYSTIAISDADSDDPIEGLNLTVFGQVELLGRLEEPTPLAPTDQSGRTLIPVTAYSTVSDVLFTVTVPTESGNDVLDVANRVGACSIGAMVSVCVLDTDAEAPPAPRLEAVAGSNPPVIRIDGYLRAIEVCSANTGTVLWAVSPFTPGYYDSITFGSVPTGFTNSLETSLLSTGGKPINCSRSVADLPENSFVITAYDPFGNNRTIGDPYCLDTEGAVIACDQ